VFLTSFLGVQFRDAEIGVAFVKNSTETRWRPWGTRTVTAWTEHDVPRHPDHRRLRTLHYAVEL
jgi:hypothetical protein